MLHGHNGKLSVSIERKELDTTGFVIDFGDLKIELNKISDIFDHKTILNKNDELNKKIGEIIPADWIVWFDVNPSAENIAKFIAEKINEEIISDKLIVKLWETDSSYAQYTIDNKI